MLLDGWVFGSELVGASNAALWGVGCMVDESSRFTSDRRGRGEASWADEEDWNAGVSENVVVAGGGLSPHFAEGDAQYTVFDDFDDGVFDTSIWRKVIVSGGSVSERNNQIELRGGGRGDNRPYLRTADEVQDGQNGNPCSLDAMIEFAGDRQQIVIALFWDGTAVGKYATAENSIEVHYSQDAQEWRIQMREGTEFRREVQVPFNFGSGARQVEIDFNGDFSSFTIDLVVDGSSVLSHSDSFSPTASCPFVGFAPREFSGGINIDSIGFDR
ncbi:hypothetical protein BN903_326 [Halorubrum sp. AJ67]|nr:hypothetical protein BN903_326 [Halorubrum sp. AJ67]